MSIVRYSVGFTLIPQNVPSGKQVKIDVAPPFGNRNLSSPRYFAPLRENLVRSIFCIGIYHPFGLIFLYIFQLA